MTYTVIAKVNESMDSLFKGLEAFPAERVFLISEKQYQQIAKKTKEELEKRNVKAHIKIIQGNIWEEMFRAVAEIKSLINDNLIINVGTADKQCRCAATCAGFVNGIKVFDVTDQGAMLLPILKFSYYKILTDKKMHILRVLEQNKNASLELLHKKTRMSLPLISYHINGNLKSEGLKDLGLVETQEEKGRITVNLTTLAKLLLKGYVDQTNS